MSNHVIGSLIATLFSQISRAQLLGGASVLGEAINDEFGHTMDISQNGEIVAIGVANTI